ncbi:FAD-binding oxidoreductase [bacterium]|nr:FAD-binding oxidoreductase [bacterium]
MTAQAGFEVAIVGASLASMFAAATLARSGLKILLVEVCPPQIDLGVLWPGLTEHWGMLVDSLGQDQCESLLGVMARSRDLLLESSAWALAQGRRGAVMQLASNSTEMMEMTARLRWLSEIWPRRLMSAGSASNYMTVNEVEGAAFVSDCCACQPATFRSSMLAELIDLGVKIVADPGVILGTGRGGEQVHVLGRTFHAEIVLIGAGHQSLDILGATGRWLFPQAGAVFEVESVDEPWNSALVGIESHRGHLMLAPHGQRSWSIAGMSPEGDLPAGHGKVNPRLVETLAQLAGERLGSLEGLVTSQPRSIVYTCSSDGLPAVGPVVGGHRWLLAGFAGRSWSMGPALGEQVALALLAQPTPLLSALPCLRPRRFANQALGLYSSVRSPSGPISSMIS